jgi:aromatic ring hydroxylase
MPDPETGEPINVSHMIPRSLADLERRHACLQTIAEFTVGLMGRTPDYMNVTFAGFAGRADEWAINGNQRGAANLVAYQKFLARNDLSLTHTIIHPTIDKAEGDVPKPGNDVALHKVADTAHGIVVRGAKILATLAPFADEIAVYPAIPLLEGTDAYALSFCIPVDTPGLKFLCRDSCATAPNNFDHPLSSRFDEQDAFVIFDDVEVPRDRVFIDGNLVAYNTVMTTGWYPNIMQQTMIRAQTKLEFAYGLATRMAEAINDVSPATRQMLGEIWTYPEFARAAIHSAEVEAFDYGKIITLLGSHNLLAAPTQAQLSDPKLRPLADKYLRGAGEMNTEERARIFRLAWDFVGSALASRNELYERFYLASGARNYQLAHILAPKERARSLVDGILGKKRIAPDVQAGQEKRKINLPSEVRR